MTNKLTLEKEIYANYTAKKTKEQIKKILDLEISEHLKKYPELEFYKNDKPTDNGFGGHIYTLHFKYK